VSPEEAKAAWELLMVRVRDLAIDAYYIAQRLNNLDKDANGRHVFVGDQIKKAIALCDDLTKLHTARVAATKEKPPEGKK
jgi:hypothetical protein